MKLFLLKSINLSTIFHTRNHSNYNFTTATTIQTTDKILVETTVETISNFNNDSSKKVMLDLLWQFINNLLTSLQW